MILNRRGITAVLTRGYALIATGLLLLVGSASLFQGSSSTPARANAVSPAFMPESTPAQSMLSNLPVIFEANQGQAPSEVKFLARGSGYGLFLTPREAVLSLRGSDSSVVHMALANANPAPAVDGNDPLPGKANYLIGNNPAKWRSNVPTFTRIRYSSVYPGIDLVYYGKQGKLEYDFEVAPAADPAQVSLRFQGAESLRVSPEGDLLLASGLRFQAPRIYQTIGEQPQPVQGRFVIRNSQEVGFEVGGYDRTRTLVIDPVLVYSTYLGGNGAESSPRIFVDSSSNMYVAVSSTSNDHIASGAPVQADPAGAGDVLITKIDSGGLIAFQTYLGGAGLDTVGGVAVDAGFNIAVTGATASANFPALNGLPTPPTITGTHAFVTSLNPTGSSILYSTYILGGGIDKAVGIALDVKNKIYVIGTTTSTNLPTTAGAFHTASLATNQFFVAKIDPVTSGTESVPYLTYFGGGNPSTGTVEGGGIAVDANSNVYITGGTNFANTGTNAATDFPILNANQNCLNSPTKPTTCSIGSTQTDAFVAKLNVAAAVGDQLLYSTYVGGAGDDVGNGIALDSTTNAYITGRTNSTEVITQGLIPFQANPGGGGANDAFLAKLSSFTPSTSSTTTTTVTQLYFTYIGGTLADEGLAVAVDSAQGARVTGVTSSPDLPLQNPINTFAGGTTDAFVARIDTTATTAVAPGHYLTYLGGGGDDQGTSIAVDGRGAAYVAGDTTSSDFPRVSSTRAISGGSDAFVSKFGPIVNLAMTAVSNPALPDLAAIGNQVTFTYTVTNHGDLVTGVNFSEQFNSASGTFSSATSSPGSCGTPAGTPSVLSCAIGTLNAGATATVTVVMTPTSKGAFGNSATLSVAGTGFTTSATATATVADFAMSINPPTRTTPAGTAVTYSITVTPDGAASFPDSVSLACGTGLPTGGSCEFINNPISNLSTGAQSRVLTINTTARVTTTTQLRPSQGPFYATWLPVSGLAFLGLGSAAFSRRRKILLSVLFGLFLTAIAFQVGCGDSTKSTTTTTGTPAGTYTVTVNATSGSASRSSTVQLVVQ